MSGYKAVVDAFHKKLAFKGHVFLQFKTSRG